MKDQVSLKKRCEFCYYVRRKRLFIYCSRNAKHKTRQA